MPIYEFECETCRHQFEYMVFRSSDPLPRCPACKGRKIKKLLSAGNLRDKPLTSGVGGFPTKKYPV